MTPQNLREEVEAIYQKAIENGHVRFTESSTKRLKDQDTGMSYQISFAPSLQNKPEREPEESKPKVNPFEKPEPELTVMETYFDDYRLLLNKFPVTPNHLLLVTKEYKHQTSPLTPKDLLASYQLLCSLDDEDEMMRHIAFYNCGPNSGSSQDHKHLQFLALPSKFIPFQDKLCRGKEFFLPNAKEGPLQDSKVSFAHYVVPLPEDSSKVDEEVLAMVFVSLLQRTLSFFQDWTAFHSGSPVDNEPIVPAYNFIMTREWMCLVPRSKAFCSELDLGFNATGYAGLILVKWEDTMNAIAEDVSILNRLLLEASFPNDAGEKPTEYQY